MHVAAATSGVDVMQFLVDKKADKEARNRNVRETGEGESTRQK